MSWVNNFFKAPVKKEPPSKKIGFKEAALPNISMLPENFEINSTDITWRFIAKWANDELAKLHKKNEKLERDHAQTMALRGEIKCLRRLLSLPKKGILTDARRR